MSELSSRFVEAIRRLDAIHAQDPRRERVDGVDQPYELVYAQRMSDCLEQVAPDASEALRLAVRAQHLRRWSIPRERYPEGRAGYHAWRRALASQQASEAAVVLAEVGYPEQLCEHVARLIRKENLRRDPEAQTLEDVACLVFLRYYFRPFAAKHDEERLRIIVRKTWRKMSERAQELALALPLAPAERALIVKALA